MKLRIPLGNSSPESINNNLLPVDQLKFKTVHLSSARGHWAIIIIMADRDLISVWEFPRTDILGFPYASLKNVHAK